MNVRAILRAIIYIFVFTLFLNKTTFSQSFSAGALAGTNSGPGLQVQGSIKDLAKGFPFTLRFGIGYTATDPGSAVDARKIFINNATNGVPGKKGWQWDFRFDFMYKVNWFSWQRFYFYGGPRLSHFTGNFNFVGGNEDFDVRSTQWGLGLGLEKLYAMSAKLDLVVTAGLDYYKKDTLQGHDTAYSPNGDIVNGREDYTYENADEAIKQPGLAPRVLIGVNYNVSR